ncbi:MAG TPA: oligosaccharide flippase family protein [Cyclobacteriaceae bacterium]|nr:oligosaccharide flippase family protein [Cyclobacteriaceae bacterium]
MGKVFKESLLTTVFSYIGVIIGYINMLWLLPFVLNPSQIGLFKTIQDMGLILVPFAQLGLGNGITRFYPEVKRHQFSFFTLSLVISSIGFTLVALLFFAFRDSIMSAYQTNSPEVNNFLLVVLLITLFSVFNTILDAFCRSFMKIAIPSFFRDVFLRVMIALLIIFHYIGWLSFDHLIWGLSAVYLFTLLAMTLYMASNRILKFDFNFKVLPRAFQKEFFQYSFITLLATTGALLIAKIDSLMVTSLIGLEANAVYAIAFAMAVVIEMPRRAVSQVVMPVIAEKFSLNQTRDIDLLYKNMAVNQSLVCVLIFLLIWVNVDSLYHFVPNSEIYQTGKWVVLLISLGKLTDVFFSINGEIIIFSRYYLFNVTATLLMCAVVILLNLWFIPVYGIEGAALSSLIAMFFFNLIKYVYIKVRLGFDPFSGDLAKVLFLGLMLFFLDYVSPKVDMVLLDLLLRSSLLLFLYGLGIYIMNIAKEAQFMLLTKFREWYKGF